MKRFGWLLGAVLIVVVAVLGIYNVQESTAEDTSTEVSEAFQDLGDNTEDAARDAGNAIEDLGDDNDLENNLEDAGDDVTDTLEDAGNDLENRTDGAF